MTIEVYWHGISADARTNQWTVKCECGRKFNPQTTMFTHQSFQCPKCCAQLVADWSVPKVEAAA